jgi:hypothetical protein
LSLWQSCSSSQAQATAKSPHRPISFFTYTPVISGAPNGDDAIRAQFQEFVDHLGNRSRYGSVGVALNYPYLTYVTGRGPASFAIDTAKMKRYEANVRVAHEMGLPVVVGFNDGPWFSPGSPFYAYWKTADGGRFLARYQDGQVNESLHSKGSLTKEELEPFLGISLYDVKRSQNALLLTLSPYAAKYRRCTPEGTGPSACRMAAHRPNLSGNHTSIYDRQWGVWLLISQFAFWRRLAYRLWESDDRTVLPPLRNYWLRRILPRSSVHVPESWRAPLVWFSIWSAFVSDAVSVIRKRFPSTIIYTHPRNARRKAHSRLSPTRLRVTATNSIRGWLDSGNNSECLLWKGADFRELVTQFSEKANGHGWALAEFNPGKNWPGSRVELSQFSFDLLRFLADHHVSIITLLAWESNELDAGIKDSGVDDAVKRFLKEGQDAGNARQP